MISTLHIENVGIIDNLSIDLDKGFNVLTGETGAGKTLIVGSLQILAGGRFSKEMIRTGEPSSYVELSLYLPNAGYEDDTVIVSREINLSGKNICKINGRLSPVSELREFMKNIINIHGQNENQSILEKETHIEFLDKFAKEKIKDLLKSYETLYEERSNILLELDKNYGNDIEKQRKIDLLEYQIKEIENAKLKPGEEEELENKRKIMENSKDISEGLNEGEYLLRDECLEILTNAKKSIEKIASIDDKYSSICERLNSAFYEIEDISDELSGFKDDMFFDENEKKIIEDRLDLIYSLKRKYGNSIEQILGYLENINKELYEINNLEKYTNELKLKLKEIEEKMRDLANKMKEIRKATALILERDITNELHDLEMNRAEFKVHIEELKEFNKYGLDDIEFLIKTNAGDVFKPLIKIASGGEMARIMLGIKKVLAEIDNVKCLVFDEIDTGISGMAANKVAEKIKDISKNHQVLCVTHLAAIASKGDHNFYISKVEENEKTITKVKKLDEKSKENEIKRLIGDVSF